MLDFPSATPDDLPHVRLVLMSQSNGPQAESARVTLLKAYRPLLLRYLKSVPPALREDTEQQAILGFLDAVRRFDPTRGTSVGAFAGPYVRGAITRFVAAELEYWGRTVPLPEQSIDDAFEEVRDPDFECLAAQDPGFDEVDRRVDVQLLTDTLCVWVAGLSRKHKEVLRLKFIDGMTQSDIARHRGVSRAAVSKLLLAIYKRGSKEVRPVATIRSETRSRDH